MGEFFGDWVPQEWQESVFSVIRIAQQHRLYLLTKCPENLIKFSPFPENCWVGVTVTDNIYLSGALERLRFIEAKVRFISFEPLSGQIVGYDGCDLAYLLEDSGIDWVIIGAQSKPAVYPEEEWVEEIVEAADKAGIKVFLKNNLWDLLCSNAFDNDIFWANERATLRQEMPDDKTPSLQGMWSQTLLLV